MKKIGHVTKTIANGSLTVLTICWCFLEKRDANWWMSIGTWVLVIITGYYMGKQATSMKEQVDVMREQNQGFLQLESQLIRPFAILSLPDSTLKIEVGIDEIKDSVFFII